MPPIIVFFIFAISFCAIVLFFNVGQLRISQAENIISGQGKVLGVSEKAGLEEYKNSLFKNNLPASDEAPVLAPVKKENYVEPVLPDGSIIIKDIASGKILAGKDADKIRPIASITKLATTLALLETKPDWQEIIAIEPGDIVSGGRIYAGKGEKLSLKDLLYLSLIGSDNTAVMALVRSTGLSEPEFVDLMNKKMRSLGLADTNFIEPVGISNNNVSTAAQAAELARIAFSEPIIQEASLIKNLKIKTAGGRTISARSTDDLLSVFPQNGIRISGGKTGYTQAAGYCFAGKFIDAASHGLISVILGADNIKDRFSETKKIVDWAYANYEWR